MEEEHEMMSTVCGGMGTIGCRVIHNGGLGSRDSGSAIYGNAFLASDNWIRHWRRATHRRRAEDMAK